MVAKKTDTTKVDIKETDTKQEIASLKKDIELIQSQLIEVNSKLNDDKYLYSEVRKYEIRNSYKN